MTSSTIPADAALRTTWIIDPAHSSVEFRVRHMMVTTVKGRFTGVQGQIIGNPEDPTHAEVDVIIDASSINTGSEERDAHLRSADFLDVEHFPTITFKSTRVDEVSDEEIKVTGDLAIHGVTREVTLDVTINGVGRTPFGTEVLGLTGKTKFKRSDFGLNWNVALETGGWLVGDTVNVEVDIEAIRQEAKS